MTTVTVEDVIAAAKSLEATKGRDDEMRGIVMSTNQAIVDLLTAVSKQGPAQAQVIASAMATAMREVKFSAPDVKVSVPAPAPAAPAPKCAYDVSNITYDEKNRLTGMRLTPVEMKYH